MDYRRNRMCKIVLLLVTYVAMIHGSEAHHCSSPQYARYNEKVILKCDIQPGFKGVYWSKHSDPNNPFIKIENDEISGSGYDSGEYNILLSGALVVNNVAWKHAGIFELLVLDKLLSLENSSVRLEVIVEPHSVAPAIKECKESTYCTLYGEDYESLQCVAQGARPAVQLQWFLTQPDGKDVLDFPTLSVPTDEGTFNSSSSIIMDRRILSVLPSVLICIASGSALELSTKLSQTSVLLESSRRYKSIDLTKSSISNIYVEEGYTGQFPCAAFSRDSLLIWRAGASLDTLKTITYTFGGSNAYEAEGHLISRNGTLVLRNVRMNNEGLYVCLVKRLSLTLGSAYRLVVIVPPSPSFPVIIDCFNLACKMTVDKKGTLSCTVYNVHPDVGLLLLTKSSVTQLSNQSQQKTVDEETKLSTISVRASYNLAEVSCGEYIPITCQANGPAAEVFNSTAEIKITREDCEFVDSTTANTTVVWIASVGSFILITCGFGLLYFKLSKDKKLGPSPSITKWQTRSYFLEFTLTEENIRLLHDKSSLQRLCQMYGMDTRKIMEGKEDPATTFLETLSNQQSLCSQDNVEIARRKKEISKLNAAKTFVGKPDPITDFSLQGWAIDDMASLSSSDFAVSYHYPERTCSMILIGNETTVHWCKHFQSSKVNAFRFICALDDNKLLSCCDSTVVSLNLERSNPSNDAMIEKENDLKEKIENDAQRLWGISYNRSSKRVALGVQNDNKIFLLDFDLNFLEELRVETTQYWPQHLALTSYIGREYIALCTWPQNHVLCYNPYNKSTKNFNQIERTLWAKHICCGAGGMIYVLFVKISKEGEMMPYILQYNVAELNPLAKLESLAGETCVISYAEAADCHVILTMDQNGFLQRYNLPPTDEKGWKESNWKKISARKFPNPSAKEEEETLL